MINFPELSRTAFSLGPFVVHWYGLMYLFGFGVAWLLGRHRIKHTPVLSLPQFDDLLTWGILGIILGGRLGYIIFYKPAYYFENPLEILQIWNGGMSFHGGLIGVLVSQWLASKAQRKDFFTVMDFLAPLVPPGLFFGRLGNFINVELWGKVTTVPWGMVFPYAGSSPRHPSQLYEALLEGVVLFCLLWWFSSRPRPRMAVSGLFGLGYGVARFFVEFFREPDAHIGYLAGGFFTMGMLLCLPLIIGGGLLLALAYKQKR